MSGGPKVGIGVPLYNGERFMRQALDSLLKQTHDNVIFTLVDDCSTDRSAEVAERYAARDERVRFVRNPRRLGLIENWRRTFELTLRRAPDVQYFAWGSDHDSWHAEWLGRLLAALESRPESVLAYPIRSSMDDSGVQLGKSPPRFHTEGIRDPVRRLRASVLEMSAGNMVYGLFRADMLEAAGLLRPVLLPDRLLLARLALLGEFLQVDEVLWCRRYRRGEKASLARQRRTLFSERAPLGVLVPWWIVHAVELRRWLAGRDPVPPETIGRERLVVEFLVWSWRAQRARVARRRRLWRRRTNRRVRASILQLLERRGVRPG